MELDKRIKKVIRSLEKNSFVKIICGASNTNNGQVERITTVYALSGVDVIDISADEEVYTSAKLGIQKAKEIYLSNPRKYPNFVEPCLMISLNIGKDCHFQKAVIDKNRCKECFSCIEVCPAKALEVINKSLELDFKSCYGCGRCVNACNFSSISLKSFEQSYESLSFADEIDVIELHTGNSNINEVKNFIQKHTKVINKVSLLSYSVESSHYSPNDLINQAKNLIELTDKPTIIQIDGLPMSGGNDPASSLTSIYAGALLKKAEINAYIQIAGGCNHITKSLVNNLNLKINGIGYGTFARKIILPYIEGFDELDFLKHLKKCVNITTNLVEKYS